jgi:electron-transferring-flavoprotein dehydrogenase
MRPAFRHGFIGGIVRAGIAAGAGGRLPHGRAALEADAQSAMVARDGERGYPTPDGVLTFDKLSSVYLSGNRTRDDAPNHVRVERRVPRELAETWARMCPAHVYEIAEGDDDGTVTVEVTASNCVQCGAITAKGGRLTPPEGGDGPDYTLM